MKIELKKEEGGEYKFTDACEQILATQNCHNIALWNL